MLPLAVSSIAPYIFQIVLRKLKNNRKHILLHPLRHVDQHQSGIEKALNLHLIHLPFFIPVGNDPCQRISQIQLHQFPQTAAAHHIAIHIQEPVRFAAHNIRHDKAIEK